jgi:hypothetical protein
MKTLNILTPVSRPENVSVIYNNLTRYTKYIKIIWYICYDYSLDPSNIPFIQDKTGFEIIQTLSPYEKAVGGHLHRNFILSGMTKLDCDKWCYFLDDDNLIHSDIINFVANYNLGQLVYMFSQERNGRNVISGYDTLKMGQVDTAQVLFKLSCLNDFTFENIYEADGKFILYLWDKFKNEFEFIKDRFSYYNKLRP